MRREQLCLILPAGVGPGAALTLLNSGRLAGKQQTVDRGAGVGLRRSEPYCCKNGRKFREAVARHAATVALP